MGAGAAATGVGAATGAVGVAGAVGAGAAAWACRAGGCTAGWAGAAGCIPRVERLTRLSAKVPTQKVLDPLPSCRTWERIGAKRVEYARFLCKRASRLGSLKKSSYEQATLLRALHLTALGRTINTQPSMGCQSFAR